jgi:hypothetical protein
MKKTYEQLKKELLDLSPATKIISFYDIGEIFKDKKKEIIEKLEKDKSNHEDMHERLTDYFLTYITRIDYFIDDTIHKTIDVDKMYRLSTGLDDYNFQEFKKLINDSNPDLISEEIISN